MTNAAPHTPIDTPPRVLVLMGVSGVGKTTIAMELVARLGWPYMEGDALHPPANVEKMRAGVALDDADRAPWLDAVAAWVGGQLDTGEPGIVTCSALKRRYRETILGGRPGARLVYLRGDRGLIAERLAARRDHFMPGGLLQSQCDALEEPGQDERPITVDVHGPAAEIADAILRGLGSDE